MVALILHGGCHDLPPTETEKEALTCAIRKYGDEGMKMLMAGKSALDAVVDVISLLEDDPLFDAGTGSFENLKGDVEMDALVMKDNGRCGGVLCIQNVRHPIQVARCVMEKTPHNLLSGQGAEDFAHSQGFPPYDPSLKREEAAHVKEERVRAMQDIQYYRDSVRHDDHIFSTVGMVALDAEGRLVAATSTGGIRLKMPGRVGDSAIPGAGTYCCPSVGLSATGEGEGIMRLCLTHSIAGDYETTKDISTACRRGIQHGSEIDCICGVIALTVSGEFSYAHNGNFMPVYMNRQ